jgi:hypothetical protein
MFFNIGDLVKYESPIFNESHYGIVIAIEDSLRNSDIKVIWLRSGQKSTFWVSSKYITIVSSSGGIKQNEP